MGIELKSLALSDVKLITVERHGDSRGHFCETWNDRDLEALGVVAAFVQDNQSYSANPGTIRGLHWQRAPHEQGKLIRVVRGRIFDVAVDIRLDSPTFSHWVGAELSSDNAAQLWIPRGFAHGFCTLEPETEVLYKTDSYYCADSEQGLRFDDPALGIDWPLSGLEPTLSARDSQLPVLASCVELEGRVVERRI
jgi:dTDP-4-dehydrorhamnose 3,5-epimerase